MLSLSASSFIMQKFTGTGGTSLANLILLIDCNTKGNKNEMRFLQGTNFGCPYAGYYDQPFNLLNKISQKMILENRNTKKTVDLFTCPGGNGLGDTIMAFLLNMSSKTDLSPKGFISLLSFIHDQINNDSKQFMQKIFKNCLKLLCSMMRDN